MTLPLRQVDTIFKHDWPTNMQQFNMYRNLWNCAMNPVHLEKIGHPANQYSKDDISFLKTPPRLLPRGLSWLVRSDQAALWHCQRQQPSSPQMEARYLPVGISRSRIAAFIWMEVVALVLVVHANRAGRYMQIVSCLIFLFQTADHSIFFLNFDN
jgi:hypothetical protein